MDYIREELLRQQRLWQRLLLGEPRQQEKTEEHGRKEPERSAEQETANAGETALLAETADREKRNVRRTISPERGEETFGHAVGIFEEPGQGHGGWMLPAAETAGGSLTVREVSRAFQRDARRYDGAFPLY